MDFFNIKNRFLNKEYIEVQVSKVPGSVVLNNFVRQCGKVVGISQDGNFLWIKLESRKIVKFPKRHLTEIRRYSNIGDKGEMTRYNMERIVEDIPEEEQQDDDDMDKEIDGYDDDLELDEIEELEN